MFVAEEKKYSDNNRVEKKSIFQEFDIVTFVEINIYWKFYVALLSVRFYSPVVLNKFLCFEKRIFAISWH